jgi:hypothetical protein
METYFTDVCGMEKTSNDQGSKSIRTVFVPNSYIGTDLYLKNVLVSANLLNENERNENDCFMKTISR